MGLFSYNDIRKTEIGSKGKIAQIGNSKNVHTIAREAAQLISTVRNLESETTYHYCTAGAWSLHEMIALICEKIGTARLFLSTWTITEEPMRVLFGLIEKGLISELNCLFDYRIEKRKAEAFQFAKVNASRIKLTKVHAKIAVLVNEQWAITIVGSANLTKNPRIEAGVISTCRETAEFHISWIENEINDGNTFKK
jgi:hypothetical protein